MRDLRKSIGNDIIERVVASQVKQVLANERALAGNRVARVPGSSDVLARRYIDRVEWRSLSFRKRPRVEDPEVVSANSLAVLERGP